MRSAGNCSPCSCRRSTAIRIALRARLVGAGIIGLIGIHFFNETAGRAINGVTPPGSEDEELAQMGYELIGFNENSDEAQTQGTS